MSKAAAAAAGAAAAAAADDGRVFFLKPQKGALLDKYSGGDGRDEAPRGQIIGRVERERCVEAGRCLRAMGGGGGGRCSTQSSLVDRYGLPHI